MTLSLMGALSFAGGRAVAGLSGDAVLWSASSQVDDTQEMVVEELVDIVRTEDAELQLAAIQVLGELGSVSATRALRVIVREAATPQIKNAAENRLRILHQDQLANHDVL
jgi:hypothetical protein